MRKITPITCPLSIAFLGLIAVTGCGQPQAELEVSGDPTRGRTAIRDYGCGSCHAIPGVSGANGRVGPPLTRIAKRAYLGGVLPNTPENMTRWIRVPEDVDPRTAMPNMGVTDEDARNITAYLHTLK